jgi:hypothetical protein
LVYIKKLPVSGLSLRGAMVGQEFLPEEGIGVEHALNLSGKPFSNGKSDLEMRAGCLKLFKRGRGCVHFNASLHVVISCVGEQEWFGGTKP